MKLAVVLACVACRGPMADDDRAGARQPIETAIDVYEGLRGPESVVHDTVDDVYLVSNINGSPQETDDNGYIMRLSPAGTVLVEKWIDGERPDVTLHAPRGLAIRGDVLYVVDRDALRLFSRHDGSPIASWPIPGAQFPNDLRVADDGSVYVTETGVHLDMRGPVMVSTPVIWRFSPAGLPMEVARGQHLAGPNGIVLDGDGVIAAGFFGHEVYRLGPDGTITTIATMPETQLDGLVALPDGSLLVTTWTGRGIYRIRDGVARMALKDPAMHGAASIAYDAKRQRLLIPLVLANQLWIEPFAVPAEDI